MKIYISADIEGVSGITHWDETEKGKEGYNEYAQQMTLEVKAACEGANNAGADEIWVKDAHDSARNLDHNQLPKNTKLIRGWTGHMYSMVQSLDSTFDALLFVGYHSASGTSTSPLAHTMNNEKINYIKINGQLVSEFLMHTYIAAYLNVPVAFLSGDLGICDEVKKINRNIVTIPVKEGIGDATISIHPQLALELIRNGVEESLKKDFSSYKVDLPKEFELEISYKGSRDAMRALNYPNIKQVGHREVSFKSDDFIEIVRAVDFLV